MTFPAETVVAKRLVLEAVVEKRLVVVALELVELPMMPAPKLKTVAKRLVEEAVVEKRLVVVAWVVVLRVMLLKICAPVQVGEKVWSTEKEGWEPRTKAVEAFAMEMPVEAAREEVAAPASVFAPDQ